MQLTHIVHRLGPMFAGETTTLTCDVPVKNETGRFVRFDKARGTCTCASPELATKELGPGQQTTLHVELDLRSRTGPQRFVCYLVEEGGDEWVCEVETTIYERGRFAHLGAVHFGNVDPNSEEVRATEFVQCAENVAMLPPEVKFSSEGSQLTVEAEPGRVETLESGIGMRAIPLKFRLRTSQAPGLGQGTVTARFHAAGQDQQVTSGATWNVRSFYSVTPSQVFFGTLERSAPPVERQVLIRRTDGKRLKVREVTLPSPGLSYTLQETPEDSRVRLTAYPNNPMQR